MSLRHYQGSEAVKHYRSHGHTVLGTALKYVNRCLRFKVLISASLLKTAEGATNLLQRKDFIRLKSTSPRLVSC